MPPNLYLVVLQQKSQVLMPILVMINPPWDDIHVLKQAFGLWGHLQGRINPFVPWRGEILPSDVFCNP
jgi:hypothetical protein